MAFIGKVTHEGCSGELRAMYQRQQDHYGYIPNYAKAFSHRPETLARWGRLLAEIRRPMDDRLFELATFVTAVELRNTGCSVAHGSLLAGWIGEESVMALALGGIPANLSDKEVAVVEYARKVARDATCVTESDVDSLRQAGFADAEIFDIAITISGRAFLATLLDALGVLLDPPMKGLDDAFLSALTVGRPIGEEPVEVMTLQNFPPSHPR